MGCSVEGNRFTGHAVYDGTFLVLRERDRACIAHELEFIGAVAPHASEQHTDGVPSEVPRHRAEQAGHSGLQSILGLTTGAEYLPETVHRHLAPIGREVRVTRLSVFAMPRNPYAHAGAVVEPVYKTLHKP